MRVLGIETSCDETGVAIYDTHQGLMGDVLYSQVSLHAAYGGVVPELASRDHIRHLTPLIEQVLVQASTSLDELDAIAYTAGPGLAGALLVGASVAAGLAWARALPLVPVHHLEGHLLSARLDDPAPDFPFTALLVSGGHTQFMTVCQAGDYTLLGESVDDAAGEAFDKTAQLLGLPYPGGPALARLASTGDPRRFKLPRPLLHSGDLQMSFSGLKTAVAQCIREQAEEARADIAAAFEEAVVDVLASKAQLAMAQSGHDTLVVAGGVSANQRLRHTLQQRLNPRGIRVAFPPQRLCTDNGAMIAYAAWCQLQQPGVLEGYQAQQRPGFTVHPRWDLAAYGHRWRATIADNPDRTSQAGQNTPHSHP